MEIRKLNQILENHRKKINEKSSLSFSGSKQQVQDIISKLDSEYGDLTIPEFIDMLIEKQKSGEEILDESLNESEDADVRAFLQILGKFSKTYTYKNGRFAFKPNEVYNVSEIKIKADVEQHVYRVDLYATTEDYNQWVYIGRILLKHVFEDGVKINDVYKVTLLNNTYDLRWNNWFETFCGRTMTFFKEYEVDSLSIPKERKYWANTILNELDDFITNSLDKYCANNKEDLEKADALTNKSQTLAQARREARANKNAKNTTIKQALSKSGIVKKIQALQNPTPEQLARILAAIDIQESMEDDKEPQKTLLLFDGKDVEFLKELMKKFGPETSLKKVLEQIKNKETLLQQRK